MVAFVTACGHGAGGETGGDASDGSSVTDVAVDVVADSGETQDDAADPSAVDSGPAEASGDSDTGASADVDPDAARDGDSGSDATRPLDRACLDTPIAVHELDPYGGWNAVDLGATGYFRVTEHDGRWWLVTPEGHPFFSTGVNGIRSVGTPVGETGATPYRDNILTRHGSVETWAAVTRERLRQWGFDTVGAWSDWETFRIDMPYTVIIHVSGSSWLEGDIPDYWAPEFEERAAAEAQRLASIADDPWFVGYFLDNEVRWGVDHRSPRTLFDDYLGMAPDAPGKRRLVGILAERYDDDPAAFAATWGVDLASFDELLDRTSLPAPTDREAAAADRAAFLSALSDQFFSVADDAARAVAPNHLNLGIRFVSVLTPAEVVAAAGRHTDVVSVNFYEYPEIVTEVSLSMSSGLDPAGWLAGFHELSGRPLLISEFGFRAADSGLPNSWPPMYPTFDTQQDRADRLERYAIESYAAPWVVGYHWFTYADQPAEGRFDGEDNNWGLVDIADEPYGPVVERAAWLHARMYPCMVAWAD